MGRMFPPALSPGMRKATQSEAELLLYDRLAAQLSKEWTVFYQIAWLGKAQSAFPVDGETDFIIVHPARGVLLVEVKGGVISFEGSERRWLSRSKKGEMHVIDDPFRQVVKSKYALLSKLKTLREWKDTFIDLFHAVAFPDVVRPRYEITPDSPPEIIIDCSDLEHLEPRLQSLFEYWSGLARKQSAGCRGLIDTLEWMLAKNISLSHPFRYQAEAEEREIVELTDRQFTLLDFLNRTRKAAIGGCAGSGKTLMAAEKARRLAREGFRTLLTCFNKPLARFLTTHLGEVPNLTIANFHRFCSETGSRCGTLNDCESPTQEFYDTTLPEALLEALGADPELRYDAVIVDEGQDFQASWLAVLEETLKDPKNGIFYLFYDDNQAIYGDVSTLPKEFTPYTLTENIRNTKEIFTLLSRFYRCDHGSISKGPEGRAVEIITYERKEELPDRLRRALHALLVEEGLSPCNVTVLSVRSLEREDNPLKEGLKLGRFTLKRQPSGPNEVEISSVHSYKGLENRVIIIAGVDGKFLADPALCYVGFSRPRNHLVVIGEKGVVNEYWGKENLKK